AMKKAAGSIRIDLAQYREMEVFTQFASDLDEATKEQLAYGSCLMELLKQPLCHPMSLHEQVITLFLASQKKFVFAKKERVKEYQAALLAYIAEEHEDIIEEIEKKKDLSEDLKKRILDAADEFKSRWE
ncbi:MAG: F0F1 ATP synthase subunit alpha, partial [Anaerotignum sp.]|nr:F0F1 ATP synthase subunit alpha [Anaerotignum sp.]